MTTVPNEDPLSEDDRFKNSKSSTIKPLHAVMRALVPGSMDVSAIINAFADAESNRKLDPDEVTEYLNEGIAAGWVEYMGDQIGFYRLTESGRTELGPMIEMDLKYI